MARTTTREIKGAWPGMVLGSRRVVFVEPLVEPGVWERAGFGRVAHCAAAVKRLPAIKMRKRFLFIFVFSGSKPAFTLAECMAKCFNFLLRPFARVRRRAISKPPPCFSAPAAKAWGRSPDCQWRNLRFRERSQTGIPEDA